MLEVWGQHRYYLSVYIRVDILESGQFKSLQGAVDLRVSSGKDPPRLATGAQLRAARALLGLSAEQLAAKTLLSLKTIRRAEQVHDEKAPIHAANTARMMEVLQSRGVIFLEPDDDGIGVRLRSSPKPIFGDG